MASDEVSLILTDPDVEKGSSDDGPEKLDPAKKPLDSLKLLNIGLDAAKMIVEAQDHKIARLQCELKVSKVMTCIAVLGLMINMWIRYLL